MVCNGMYNGMYWYVLVCIGMYWYVCMHACMHACMHVCMKCNLIQSYGMVWYGMVWYGMYACMYVMYFMYVM